MEEVGGWRELLDALSSAPDESIARRDGGCGLVILASLGVGLLASWQRWGVPLTDSGRELNVPLRLLRGEMLYSDVRYIYGPLSPYANAALYWIFHPSLWVLWARGIATTILILAIIYWIARQVMGRFPATMACVAITWVCALKSQGNYILPYAYSGLDGCLFGLATLALLLASVRDKKFAWLVAAGVAAALASLAKTEMGIAAVGTGVAAAALGGYPRADKITARLSIFLVPALGLPAAVMEWFASRVGWHTLIHESYLFFTDTPWQLIYFNKARFGLDHPAHSVWLMVASMIRMVGFAGAVASISLLLARHSEPARPERIYKWPLALLAASLAVFVLPSIGLSDLGPLLPMPFLLLALMAAGLAAFLRNARAKAQPAREQAAVFVLLGIFAFGSLGRILCRVSTGGALSSLLVPMSLVLYIYVWLVLFPLFFSEQATRTISRQLVSGALVLGVVAAAVTLTVRYQRNFNYAMRTPRGTWRTHPDQGLAFDEALHFIEINTAPSDAVAVLPEGSSLNFLSGRRNPLRDEIFLPGILREADEDRAIGQLRNLRVPLILITNRATQEFGQKAFGVDFYQRLMLWINENYRLCGVFGPRHDPSLAIGSPTFFIRAYCRSGASLPLSQ